MSPPIKPVHYAPDYARFGLHDALRLLLRELRVTYRVVSRDLTASVIPGTLFSLGALHATGVWTVAGALNVVARCAAYFLLYIYTFCLCNQITGYEEDLVDKPDRVLPSKLISMRGARWRFRLAMLLFPLVGLAIGGWSMLLWAVLWQATTLAYNYLGLDRHWFGKNVVFISVGTAVQLAAAWQIAAPLTPLAARWILFVSVAFGVTLHLQDLRDVAGDREGGRWTLPMSVGDDWARIIIAVSIGILPVATHQVLLDGSPRTLAITLSEAALTVLNFVVAARTLKLRSPLSDHRTYMLHTGWFCGVLASSIVVL